MDECKSRNQAMLPARSSNPRPRGRKIKETPEETLRKLQRLPDNKRCADCHGKLPGSVCLSFNTFVCSSCAGIHREFSHRIKGVGHSAFTAEEVERVQKAGGNGVVNGRFLAKYDANLERLRAPDGEAGAVDLQLCRVWIRRKYLDKAWYQEDNDDDDEEGEGEKQEENSSVNASKATIVSIPKLGSTKKTVQQQQEEPQIDLFGGNQGGDEGWDAFGSTSTMLAAGDNSNGFAFDANFDNVAKPSATSAPAFEADFGSTSTTLNKSTAHKNSSHQASNDMFTANFDDNLFNQATQPQQQQSRETLMFETSFGQSTEVMGTNTSVNPVFGAKFDQSLPEKKGNPFAAFEQQSSDPIPVKTGGANPSFEADFGQLPNKTGNPFTQEVKNNVLDQCLPSQQFQQGIVTRQHVSPTSNVSLTFEKQQSTTQMTIDSTYEMNQNQVPILPSVPNNSSQQGFSPENMVQFQNSQQNMNSINRTSILHSQQIVNQSSSQGSNENIQQLSVIELDDTTTGATSNHETFSAVDDAFAGLALDSGASPLASPVIDTNNVLDEDAVIAQNVDNINSPTITKKKTQSIESEGKPPLFPQMLADSGSVVSAITMNDHINVSYPSNHRQISQGIVASEPNVGLTNSNTTAETIPMCDFKAFSNETQQYKQQEQQFQQQQFLHPQQEQQQHQLQYHQPYGMPQQSFQQKALQQPQLQQQIQNTAVPMLSNEQVHMLQLMQSMSPQQLQQMQLMMQMQSLHQQQTAFSTTLNQGFPPQQQQPQQMQLMMQMESLQQQGFLHQNGFQTASAQSMGMQMQQPPQTQSFQSQPHQGTMGMQMQQPPQTQSFQSQPNQGHFSINNGTINHMAQSSNNQQNQNGFKPFL